MFCPSCGFESTQNTNYCKRCGEDLNPAGDADAPKRKQPNVAIMFLGVIAFAMTSMTLLLTAYTLFVGWRWDNQFIFPPLILGFAFTFTVTLLLIWQLARMITTVRRTDQKVVVEKHFIRESPPVQLGAPTDQIPQAVDQPSVVEQTTRQFANRYESPKVEEKTGTR